MVDSQAQINMREELMSSRSWIRPSLGLFCAAWVALSSCSKSFVPPAENQSIRIQLSNEPVSLDPTYTEDGVSLQVLANTFEGLLGYDSNGRLEKRIAQEFTLSKDEKRLEFQLRKDAFWSDGKRIEVQDFITSFRRILGPESTSKLAPIFFPIRNAQAFHLKKAGSAALGVKEENGKLVIELEEPTPYFLQALVLPMISPLRQEILDAHAGRWPETGPSTGPYRLVSHQLDREIRLEVNPFYHGFKASKPPFKAVQFLLVSDETTAMNLFSLGKLDVITRIPSFEFPKLKEKGLIQTHPFHATYYLSFNCRKPPFNDSHWRRAVAGVIQREEIATLLGGGEMSAWSWIPPGLEGFIPYRDPQTVFHRSIVEGRKRVGSLSVPVTAGFDSGVRNSRIMEKVQQDLKSRLGMKVSLLPMDWKTYTKTLQAEPPQLFRFGWMAPFNDPMPLLRVFVSDDPNNYSGCKSSRYDALVKEIGGLKSGAIREKKILQAQKVLLEEEAMVIPIYHYVQNVGVSSRVKQFRVSPFGSIQVKDLMMTDH